MTEENQTQNDEDFDYGCECAMTLLNEPTEDRLNDLIDELDEDGMISTEVVYGLLATILMSMNEEEHEGDEHYLVLFHLEGKGIHCLCQLNI